MAIKIDASLLDDVNNPPLELVARCIEQQRAEIPRLQKLSDYYDGKHDVLKREKREKDKDKADVVVNHAKYITDMNVGFMLGNPVAYSETEENGLDIINKALDDMRIKKHD
ncbi:phage portal protein, partial [Arthrospira platensis SPKY2]